MGPAASVRLYKLIVELSQKKYKAEQDTDFPPVFLYSLALEGFDEKGFVDPDLIKKQLIAGVKKIESSGVDFIIIACNTVHFFYKEMQSSVKVPILSIVEETARAVQRKKMRSIGLLCSESTRLLGMYQKTFAKYGIKIITASDEEQLKINEVVLHVMSGHQDRKDKIILKKNMRSLCKKGAQGIVLGCTELPLAINQTDTKTFLFDSLAILAQSALSYAYSKHKN